MTATAPTAPRLDRPPRWRAWIVVAVVTLPVTAAGIMTVLDNRRSAQVESDRMALLKSAVRALDERADQQRADMARRERIAELEAARLKGPLTPDDADDLERLRRVDDGNLGERAEEKP